MIYVIKTSDYQSLIKIAEKHPSAINERPTSTPLWLRKFCDIPAEYTPLQVAVQIGNYEISEFLIEAGADVNIQDDMLYDTPLIICLRANNNEKNSTKYKIAEMLLDNGADPLKHRVNNGTYDALGACVIGMLWDDQDNEQDGIRIFERMIQIADTREYDPMPLLLDSISLGNIKTTQIILEYFDISDAQKLTAYNLAEEKGYEEIVELLK